MGLKCNLQTGENNRRNGDDDGEAKGEGEKATSLKVSN